MTALTVTGHSWGLNIDRRPVNTGNFADQIAELIEILVDVEVKNAEHFIDDYGLVEGYSRR